MNGALTPRDRERQRVTLSNWLIGFDFLLVHRDGWGIRGDRRMRRKRRRWWWSDIRKSNIFGPQKTADNESGFNRIPPPFFSSLSSLEDFLLGIWLNNRSLATYRYIDIDIDRYIYMCMYICTCCYNVRPNTSRRHRRRRPSCDGTLRDRRPPPWRTRSRAGQCRSCCCATKRPSTPTTKAANRPA